jgi:hypothetical protein
MKSTSQKMRFLALGLSLLPAIAMAHQAPPPAPTPDVSGLLNEHVIGPVVHTAARDQGDAGFCWAYSFSGLIESEALKQGKAITLSPEYLALNHIPYMIQSLYPLFETADSSVIFGGLLKHLIGKMFDPEGSLSLTETLTELGEIGVVPESVYNYKFPFATGPNGKLQEIHPTLQEKLEAFTKTNLLNKSKLNYYKSNPDALRQDLAKAIGVSVPKPTDTFTYDGQSYTALTFMKNYLGYDPKNYQEVVIMDGKYAPDPLVATPTDKTQQPVTGYSHAQALETIRAAVKDNVAVPIAFLVYEDQKQAEKSGVFTPKNCLNNSCTKIAGGHSVLITGLKDDVQSSSDPIDALIIKNSWGDIALGDMGQTVGDDSQKGFFLITQDYLTQAEKQPKQSGWSFAVPKQYLKK